MTALGCLLFFSPTLSFEVGLDISIRPPPTSASGIAKTEYARYFPPSAIQVVVLLSSADGSPLLNTSVKGHWLRYQEASATRLTPAAAQASHTLRDAAKVLDEQCDYQFLSYWDLLNVTNRTRLDLVGRAEHFAAREAEPTLFDEELGADSTLVVVSLQKCKGRFLEPSCVVQRKPWCSPIADVSDAFQRIADEQRHGDELRMRVVSLTAAYQSVQDGVDRTMLISTCSAVPAAIILGLTLRNLRQLLITLCNVLGAVACAILCMYPLSRAIVVSAEAPALMLAAALALSVDYSLFLLSRFNLEVHERGRPARDAVVTMLETSGHTVLVSGTTLCLCFLGMLLIPTSTISTMGVGAAFAVAFAIAFALVLTPALLLSLPAFLTANRRFGLSLDAIGRRRAPDPLLASYAEALIGDERRPPADAPPPPPSPVSLQFSPTAGAQPPPPSLASGVPRAAPQHPRRRRSVWAAIGSCSQRPWVAVALLLACGCVAVPFALPLLRIDYVEGVMPLLPRGAPTTVAFAELQV